MQKKASNLAFTILMILAMISWGGSWTSAKLVSTSLAPEVLIFWCFLATFISMIPVMFIARKSMKLDLKTFILIVSGAVLLVIYNQLFFNGLRTGMAGSGGVLVTSLNPVVTCLLTAVLLKRRFKIHEIIGLVMGFSGGLIIMGIWRMDAGAIFSGGNLFFLIASVVWALLTIVTQKTNKISSLVYSFYLYGFSTVLDFILAMPYGVNKAFQEGPAFWFNIIYLSVVATTFGTTAYFFASGKLGASKASSYVFLVPTSAILISWAILKEKPQISTLIGGFLAMVAVYIINKKPAV